MHKSFILLAFRAKHTERGEERRLCGCERDFGHFHIKLILLTLLHYLFDFAQ